LQNSYRLLSSVGQLGDVRRYASRLVKSETVSGRSLARIGVAVLSALGTTLGGQGRTIIVRQFSPCFGLSAFAHLVWHSSFTPQMALGEQSLQAHSFLEEPPFSSQYRYAFASSTIHISATNVSTEANVMVFMEDLKG
jgi:hypothetical protein